MKKIIVLFFVLLSFFEIRAQNTLTEIRNRFFHPSSDYVMVVSHRGDWRNVPENSIPAVMNALKMGVEIVEIDIQKTKDNRLIVMHDKSIDRMTTGKGVIATLPLDSIKKFFLKDVKGKPTNNRVATLDELMLAVKGKPLLVNVDKGWENFYLVMDITEKTGTTPQVILKGNAPIGKLREQYGKLIDKVIYMPMVWPADYTIYERENYKTPYEYTKAFIDGYTPKGFEVILKDEKSSVDDALALMKSKGITIWINALWDDLCGGHADNKALKEPDAHWGWIIRKGANIIQTDYPIELIKYLKEKGLHK